MTTSDLKRILFYVFTSLAKILKISDKNEGLQTLNYSKKFKIKLSKVSVQMTNHRSSQMIPMSNLYNIFIIFGITYCENEKYCHLYMK